MTDTKKYTSLSTQSPSSPTQVLQGQVKCGLLGDTSDCPLRPLRSVPSDLCTLQHSGISHILLVDRAQVPVPQDSPSGWGPWLMHWGGTWGFPAVTLYSEDCSINGHTFIHSTPWPLMQSGRVADAKAAIVNNLQGGQTNKQCQ